ncbi:MAG: hypothetical protein KDD38_06525 [Bdellovibrionales bacterium]|nr:hypothetical protein [Bdellovibrionales bacterium]
MGLILVLSGCGLFNVETKRQESPTVREVPFEARSGDLLKKKLLVLPFLDSELQRSRNVVDVARRTVIDELIDTRNFIVINNSDIAQDLGAFVKESKEYDMSAVSKLAAQVGVSAVIEGRILEIRAKRVGDEVGLFRKLRAQVDVAVQIRVYGAKSGREIYNGVRKATVEHETTRVGESAYSDRFLEEDPGLIRAGVKKAFTQSVGGIVKAVEKLSWEGRIAMVNGEKIYVNAGRLSGIQVGDILKVTEEGDEVFDPDNGVFIGKAQGRMKGTVEVVSYFGKDGAVAIIHSGSGFQENDPVQLY